jgi:chorismate dehydratase
MRLGHIEYSNCFPVHARLIDEPRPDVSLITAIPSVLNAALASGEIDVAPCSSIELARHGGEYRVLPRLVIGADGPVQSILLESTRPIDELDAAPVLLPTASATSVVLLRILLELRSGLQPRYSWYDQASDADPVDHGAAAVLRIGDVALRRQAPHSRRVYDLGELWSTWTGLPFAFAVWQARADVDGTSGLAALHDALLDSRAWFAAHDERLARAYAGHFGIASGRLLAYWRSLRYDLDERMQQGVLHYYALAARLDEAASLGALPWANVTGV